MFITFEGPNGVGKTTITNIIFQRMLDLGYDVYLTKEPTKSSFGNFFRKAEEFYDGTSLACIAAADRYFHIHSEIKPALNSGKIVISDRYVESSLVLQRIDKCPIEFIWSLNSRILVPDISVIIVASHDTIRNRLISRNSTLSRFERKGSSYKEVDFYRNAGKFLMSKGFNVVFFDNESSLLEDLANRVINKILNHSKICKGGIP